MDFYDREPYKKPYVIMTEIFKIIIKKNSFQNTVIILKIVFKIFGLPNYVTQINDTVCLMCVWRIIVVISIVKQFVGFVFSW